MQKKSLKMQLSLRIALVSLITVALISFLSNILINQQFKEYRSNQQKQKAKEITQSISNKYYGKENKWDISSIHTIGMSALYDGYIIKVFDKNNDIVWDAETDDTNLCSEIMSDISENMKSKYPNSNGKFSVQNFDLILNNKIIGSVTINYYGPYFFNKDDFDFLSKLNMILIGSGIFSLIFSIIIGFLLAKHITRPITKTIDIAKQISQGEYEIYFGGKTKTRELDELVTSINQLAGDLNNQEKFRKQLTADVAHELRTPLTTLSTHLEAMIEGIWMPTEERLSSCYEEINRIINLVKHLESLARVESDNLKLNKTVVNVKEIISTIQDNFAFELKNKNLKFNLEGNDTYILLDKDRITQVILNLICNAIKYTTNDGRISVKIIENDIEVIIVVEDDGIGIPEEELSLIFERFYRTEKSRNRKTGGAGIGLTIVKAIVLAHGGRVEATSDLEHGSCFKVFLPKNNEMYDENLLN
ncbi:HAMP domain-containing sensor histidine kinase [uncultured Clostridium sp.]|uniref:sensor histidine kinase n=1 Tax=uncultured Clostridium sp. TaxID=59620 RepID=UPI0028EEED87|nr:HAMP domain-containing sensor histidine kinase [uncultured Clostridium sp.]